jgi:hypothetical protein
MVKAALSQTFQIPVGKLHAVFSFFSGLAVAIGEYGQE